MQNKFIRVVKPKANSVVKPHIRKDVLIVESIRDQYEDVVACINDWISSDATVRLPYVSAASEGVIAVAHDYVMCARVPEYNRVVERGIVSANGEPVVRTLLFMPRKSIHCDPIIENDYVSYLPLLATPSYSNLLMLDAAEFILATGKTEYEVNPEHDMLGLTFEAPDGEIEFPEDLERNKPAHPDYPELCDLLGDTTDEFERLDAISNLKEWGKDVDFIRMWFGVEKHAKLLSLLEQVKFVVKNN